MYSLTVFTLQDEQIVWTDKSSDGLVDYCEFNTTNSANFVAIFPQNIALFASSIPPRRANRQFVRLSPSECEFRSDFGQLVRLDGQIVFKKSSSQTDKFRRRLKIRSSRFHIRRFVRLRRFVCPDDLFVF